MMYKQDKDTIHTVDITTLYTMEAIKGENEAETLVIYLLCKKYPSKDISNHTLYLSISYVKLNNSYTRITISSTGFK